MKKTIAALILFIFAVPFSAMAHTGLSSSNPAEGEQISEPLEEINLIFETQIETGSTMALESDGQSFLIDEITASGNTLQGQLADSELPNGDYILAWSIIGEDGHPIKGEVSFRVAVEADPAEAAVEETPVEENIPAETAAPTEEAQVADTAAQQDPGEGNMLGTVLIAILAIVVTGIAFKVFKMKK